MTAFADAVDQLFADRNIAREGLYVAAGGAQRLVRIVTRRADDITSFGDARLWAL